MKAPRVGNIYKMRDGRYVEVTDVASQHPDDYTWYAEDGETINAVLAIESIFVGTQVSNFSLDKQFCDYGGTIVSDLSEIDSLIC